MSSATSEQEDDTRESEERPGHVQGQESTDNNDTREENDATEQVEQNHATDTDDTEGEKEERGTRNDEPELETEQLEDVNRTTNDEDRTPTDADDQEEVEKRKHQAGGMEYETQEDNYDTGSARDPETQEDNHDTGSARDPETQEDNHDTGSARDPETQEDNHDTGSARDPETQEDNHDTGSARDHETQEDNYDTGSARDPETQEDNHDTGSARDPETQEDNHDTGSARDPETQEDNYDTGSAKDGEAQVKEEEGAEEHVDADTEAQEEETNYGVEKEEEEDNADEREEANQSIVHDPKQQEQLEHHEETGVRNDIQSNGVHESPDVQVRGSVHHVDPEVQIHVDTISDSSRPLDERMRVSCTWLESENQALKKTHFKDYSGLENLKTMVSAGDVMLSDYHEAMDGHYQQMERLRRSLADLSATIDGKLTNEGVISWQDGPKAYPSDAGGVAKERRVVAEAAEARSRAAVVHRDLARAEERVCALAEEAAIARDEARQAAEAARAAAKEAERAKFAAQEKKRAEEEAKRKAEQGRHQKEELERKKKEEEERRRREAEIGDGSPEEQERRIREQERKDPKNWPHFIYSVDGGELNIPVGGILRALPGTLDREEVSVTTLEQSTCPVDLSQNEELVSHIVHIQQCADFKITEPLSLALPHCAPRNVPSRELVVKERVSAREWRERETREVHFDDVKEYKFVEVRLTRATATVAVVTRPRRETLVVTRKASKLVPNVDPRICFVFRPVTFKSPTNMKVEIQPVDLTTVSDVKYRKPVHCEHLLASSPIVQFLLPGNHLPKPMVVNVPVPPNPNKLRRPQTSVGDRGDKAGRKPPASRPMSAIMASYSKKEDEAEDNLYLLTKSPDEGWGVVCNVPLTQSKGKDIVSMELCKPIGRFVMLRTKTAATARDAEKIATCLDDSIKERVVQVILRQKTDDPHAVTLHCVPVQRSERYQRKLTEDGYEHGPAPSDDLVIHEGQKMTIKFRGNLQEMGSERDPSQPMEFVYNSHIATNLDFHVDIIDKFAQKSLDSYRGFTQIFKKNLVPNPHGDENNLKTGELMEWVEEESLMCELLVSLPKPEPESPKPIVVRTPVMFKCEDILDNDYLKQISCALGEEWKIVAQQLGIRRMRIQAIMRNNVTRNNESVVYEMLSTWAKRIPRSINKVEVLCNALSAAGRVDLVEDIKDREDEAQQERRRYARVAYLKKAFIKVAQSGPVMNQWRHLGRAMDISQEALDDVDRLHPGIRDKVTTCLTRWRDAQDGPDVMDLMKVLRRCRWGRVATEIQASLGLY